MLSAQLLAVASGGALGAVLRWLIVTKLSTFSALPYGTLTVNIVGSLVIGLCAAIMLAKPSESWRLFLMVGVLGGFTTFSAFSLDTLTLINKNEILNAALYVGGSLFASLIAVFAGYGLGHILSKI